MFDCCRLVGVATEINMKIMFVLTVIGGLSDQCVPVLVRTRWVMVMIAIRATQNVIIMQCPQIRILARMFINLPKCVAVRNNMAENKGNMATWERRGGKMWEVKKVITNVAGGRGEANGVKMNAGITCMLVSTNVAYTPSIDGCIQQWGYMLASMIRFAASP